MEENKILFLGRVVPIKSLETVIKSLSLLEDKEIKFEIVGPKENNYYNKLQNLIRELKLSDRVFFSQAIWNIKEKIKKIDSCKIFILPSKTEGMPQSLIEGLSRKKLVIASDNKASRDLILDGKNGFLFEVGNEKSLAKTINKVLNLNTKKKTLVKKEARKSVEQFSWDNIIKKIETLISN